MYVSIYLYLYLYLSIYLSLSIYILYLSRRTFVTQNGKINIQLLGSALNYHIDDHVFTILLMRHIHKKKKIYIIHPFFFYCHCNEIDTPLLPLKDSSIRPLLPQTYTLSTKLSSSHITH